jgi:hypothetical protein
MRGFIVPRRTGLWVGLVGVLGLLGAGDVASVREQITKLEAQQRSIESNLKKARAELAELEGKKPAKEANPKQAAANPVDDETKLLEGAWRLVGVKDGNGNYVDAPYIQYKIMATGHYLWLSYDRETGRVLRTGGGSYSLKDGVYTARVEYSNAADLRGIAGQEYKFTCKIDGDKWYHEGPMPNGAYVDDLWERMH